MTPGTIVRNGSDYTFTFTLKAPAAGSYYTQYRMMWSNHYLFGQIAGHTINVKAAPTPTPTPVPTNKPPEQVSPTPTPVPHYNAHGKMIMYKNNGEPYLGPILFYYDGPLGNRLQRSSAGASNPDYPYSDWDIGGPVGHYRLYRDDCSNSFQFYMNSYMDVGTVTFRQR